MAEVPPQAEDKDRKFRIALPIMITLVLVGSFWYSKHTRKTQQSLYEQQKAEAVARAKAWNDVGLLIGEVQQQSAALAYSAAYPYLPQVEKGYHFGRLAAASEVPYPYNAIILKRIFNLNHDFLEAMAANEASTETEREEAKKRHVSLRELKRFKEDVDRIAAAIRDGSSAAQLQEIQRQLEPIHAKWKRTFTRAYEKYPFITIEDLQKKLPTSPPAGRKTGFFICAANNPRASREVDAPLLTS